ncbi:MAG: hypothetical protein J2P34_09795 [Actinobacteria bacterium]|nr:hypothetical protein [Actinomycetota bacterium]
MSPQRDTDPSGSTAQFRAFVEQPAPGAQQAPWEMRTTRKRFGTLAAVVIGVAVILALIAFGVIG